MIKTAWDNYSVFESGYLTSCYNFFLKQWYLVLKSKQVIHHLIHVRFGTQMHDRRKHQSQAYDINFAIRKSNLHYYQSTFLGKNLGCVTKGDHFLSDVCFWNIAKSGTFRGVIKNTIRLRLERKKKKHTTGNTFFNMRENMRVLLQQLVFWRTDVVCGKKEIKW